MDAITSVGLVADGDNPDAEMVAIFKHSATAEPTTPQQGQRPEENQVEALDLSTLEEDVRKAVEAHVADLTARIAALETVEEAPPEDVLKDASPSVQELVAKQTAQIAELSKAFDAEVQKRQADEFVAKAAVLKILGKPEEVGPVLHAIATADPEAFASLEGMLTAVAQRAELGEVFKEYGHGDAPAANADSVVAKARKNGDKRPAAEIRAEFWATNPEAVRALREES